uniref:GTP-binding protein Rheb n=1 Tax=Oncorhynchus mykiss TaxID=8022 RepID=A0A8C7VJH1_ONCMY
MHSSTPLSFCYSNRLRHIYIIYKGCIGAFRWSKASAFTQGSQSIWPFPIMLMNYNICQSKAIDQRRFSIFSFAGKSSLTIQFVEGQFVDSYDPTIENTFTKMITVNGQEYHLQLVDTAGQDEYSIFPQTYSIDINGYILVYSVTSNKSFEVIKVIHEKLLDMVGKVQVPIMLVGNKKDLHMERVISCEEGKALADSWNAAFMESSAKENQTAVEVFKRTILEAEKMEGGAPQGRTSCSLM